MSCGCKTSGDSSHSCGKKSSIGCARVDTCGNSYKLSVFDWLSDINNPSSSKTDFVEVRFKNDRKGFYKNVNHLPLHIGSIVTVESSPGHDVGVISLTGELVKIQMKKKKQTEDNPLKIYRLANQKDIEVWQSVREKENSVKLEARKIAQYLALEMKITDVEFQGDGGKIIFYYTADSRVDFRQLIKEYASTFRTKIDMKQIGFRQEASKIGGIGSCGRELCCSTWLTDFRSVNTNAARYQQLSINPQKLAGQCGKLKCCLNYELDSYLDVLSDFPPTSTTLETEKGKAFCIKVDVFKKKMWFAYVDHSIAWYDLDIHLVKNLINQNERGEKTAPLEDLIEKNISTPVEKDLIQENNVDRFDGKRNFSKNNSNKKSRDSLNQQRIQRNRQEKKDYKKTIDKTENTSSDGKHNGNNNAETQNIKRNQDQIQNKNNPKNKSQLKNNKNK